ncbi:MAG: VanW family protein [Myxococcota bacterium]|nr:VanW family protein [Myxococcota bacterium]
MALPPSIRERIPFGLRVTIRRLPALLRHAARSLGPAERLERAPVGFAHTQASRSSPLRRQGTAYRGGRQQAKEHNVERAAQRLDGVVIPPGAEFSWHREVGPPLRVNGFVPGPELHDGRLEMGGGGGACQLANLLYYLAAVGGLEVLERHRHGLDLFPDDDRRVPFGLGATVFYPHRDLRLRNPFPQPVHLQFQVRDGQLHGRLSLAQDPGLRFQVVEEGHRFVRRPDGIWRENHLFRVGSDGRRELLSHNLAKVTYTLDPALLS